ncbi:MAG: HsdR family type I site-specific deoxyribonuclease [Actinobacteria bacterium]|nr:HsdR family type I site-specific deoxyribonuclease [Actinomycetota bacterium]
MKHLEKEIVEFYVIEKLKECGWKYIQPEHLERFSFDEPLLISDLKRKLIEINKDVNLTEEDLKQVILKLQSASSDQNGHREILNYIKFGVPIKTEKERIVKFIQLFDYKNLNSNDFIFTNQYTFVGRDNIRLDIVLFVNGIPLVNIECKNPYTGKTNYFDAYRQIKRYEKVAPELYKYIQIGIGFSERVKYFPIVPWLDDVDQFIWRSVKEDKEAGEGNDLNINEEIFELLQPENLLDILRNFLFLREFRGDRKKVVARYMQFRAANKIYRRVIENLLGKSEKNKGLIWHWQGSGKTLTMIFSAFKLYFDELLENPTIFFIVDRQELERQFSDELSSLDLGGISFERIENIEHLKNIIEHDDYRGKRGIFLTLIHKFNMEESFLLDELEKKEGINKRKNVICFLDEVHRTQYGTLAAKMKNILNNGFFFGFTGTPIFYSDRNTYKEFGYIYSDEKEWYLDKYFIDQAEKDGFVLPIVYERRKEEVSLKDVDLEWYLRETIEVEDISDELELKAIRDNVKRRINEITVFLENEKNIETICEDIAEHFKQNFDGKFKGFIVAGSRLACVRFKRIIDNFLPPKYSEVVMTYSPSNPKEPAEIQAFREELVERFGINDTNEINKKLVEEFKKDEYPKILIVADMLITGFDEPKLGVLYLYKLLKNHRLLQTVARVNRPFDGKASGLVVDYVGIFKNWLKALKVYLKEDQKLIKKSLINKDEAFDIFNNSLKELREIFGDLIGKFEKDAFDRGLEIIKKPEVRERFENSYLELRKWFEFLSSDEKMIRYLPDYKWLSCLYEYYKKLFKPDVTEKAEKIFNKTIKVVHELIEPTEVFQQKKPTIIDLNYIKKLRKSDLTENQKTIGTLMALHRIVILIGDKNPVYKSIAERVRLLVKKWQEDEISNEQLGIEVDSLISFINDKEDERKKYGLNDKEFAIKLFLESIIKQETHELMELSKSLCKRIESKLYRDWNKNPAKVQEVSKEIREFLIDIRGKYGLSYEEFDRLHKEIFEFIYENP